jgi:hypothetical protein
MKLTNEMELAVKDALANIREKAAGDEAICWCPLCRADMMALALSALPPSYDPRRAPEAGAGATLRETVDAETLRSVRRVARFPKHPRGNAVPAGSAVWVVNFPLEEGFRAVDEVLRGEPETCDCWSCRCEKVARALNRRPALYGVEFEGRTFLPDADRLRMREELASLLATPRPVEAVLSGR